MTWANKYKLIGKPIITGDKPGHQIEKVLAEIQKKAVTLIEAQNNTASDGAAQVDIKLARSGNKVTMSATVDMPDPGDVLPDGTELYQVLAWDGAKWIADFVRAT
jgi:hypothetical protein